MKRLIAIFILANATSGFATEYHVGSDRSFKTISAAAELAQPGDVITVHAGVYRERVNPPRGNVVYQAAKSEKVVITGAERLQGWERVTNDTWKVTLPNSYFGAFNPFSDKVQGEWCSPTGRHTGMVYLDGEWFGESLTLDPVLKVAGKQPLWFSQVDGADTGEYLFAIKSLSVNGKKIAADSFSSKHGELHATVCADGDGQCVGWIRAGSWLAFERLDLGTAGKFEIEAGALTSGGGIELRADKPDGSLLGQCNITRTGDWQKWKTFSATIQPVTGTRTIYLVFQPHKTGSGNTTIWAQFRGVNPNNANVEINVRQSVFYPSKPGINNITVRGFELRQAATPWAGAMSEQIGLVGTHWSKGWIIENNHVHHSMCTGITLGRYELPKGEMPPATAPGFVKSIELALRDGWSKEKIGSHIVRNNHIHHCEKNAIHGSLGACFSEISGNDIHDIATRGWVRGDDTGGIKFLGGVDVVIRDNHIYRCGQNGLWLDWMAQGAQVTGNLLHDNGDDYSLEMQHGPLLLANNVMLSPNGNAINSQGMAFAHNLMLGAFTSHRSDARVTPFHRLHSTALAGMHPARNGDSGDHRFYNNLFVAPCNLQAVNGAALPCFAAGNVFTAGARPSKFDTGALVATNFDAGVKLEQKADGWYLTFNTDKSWRTAQQRELVTTELLGKAKIPDQLFDNPDGSPIKIDSDYLGKSRDMGNPFPGPFDVFRTGKQAIKVWPKTVVRSWK
jgi:alpha-L-arabinofuranosidase